MKVANICRICLKKFEKGEELISVFENDESNIKIAKKIYDVSGVFIEKSFQIPEKICGICIKTLNISYNFRKQCQQSDFKLKSIKCSDNLYTESILKDVESDYIHQTFLKMELDTAIDQSNVKKEEDDEEAETQNINYEDYKVVSENEYETSEQCESETYCKNEDFDTIMNEVVSYEYDELIDESLEYLIDESCKFNSETKKKYTKSIGRIKKDENKQHISNFQHKWMKNYKFLQQTEDTNTAICTVCDCYLSLLGGESTVAIHLKTDKHTFHMGLREMDVKEKEEAKTWKRLEKQESFHICDICGNKYATLHLLRRHLKYHSNTMDYECELCKKKFRQEMQLRRHMRIHTGEKPYSCKYCNRAIRDYSTKIRHERAHTGERPYVCTTCNKAFQYPFVLKNHMKTHTGEKLFECMVCNKSFTLKKHLTSHLQTMLHKSQIKKLEKKALKSANSPNS